LKLLYFMATTCTLHEHKLLTKLILLYAKL
jgi:hypothetical protein